jgi:acyl dehydratase
VSVPGDVPDELCRGCQERGACRLGLRPPRLDAAGCAGAEIVCPPEFEGGAGVAHGGWTAGVLEELLGQVMRLHRRVSVLGTLTVRFERPVPVEHVLGGRAWVTQREPRKWHVGAELTLGPKGAVLARATGVAVLRDGAAHHREFERWMSEQVSES